MKKKIIALSVAFVLVAVAAIGATLSFLTDTQDIKNVYTIGDIDIDATETVSHFTGDGKEIAEETIIDFDSDVDKHTYENIQPGDVMEKVINVTNNGSNPAYVAVAVKMGNHYTFNNKIDDYYEKAVENGGKGYTEEQMEELFKSIFTGASLDYSKATSGFRLYPNYTEVVRYDQAGAKNYNKEPLTATTLLAVDAVKASSNNGVVNGFGTYKDNMFKATVDNTSGHTFAVPTFYNVTNTIENSTSTYTGERLWVYYYYVPAGGTISLDYTVVCPDVIDNYSLEAFRNMYLNVQVSGIQVTGFNSAKDAFLELNNTYPYNAY